MNIFELFGSVAMRGLDKVDSDLTRLEKRTQQVQKGMRVMGMAFTAVGAAGLAIIQSTKKINAQLGVTAMTIGSTTKEMRALTLATTNVTFPIEEVTATFDLLARAGERDEEIIKAVATSFDTLGDAIGMPASQVTAKLIPAMKTFNLNATEMASKTDKLTHLFRNTTVTLDDFNRMVGYVTPDLVEMGLTTEDMIAILAELEKQGYSGEVMTREFRKAVTLATKEQIPLNEALGITTETLEGYKAELEDTEGLTQEYADVANKQYTIMDKVKQKWSELTLKASGFLEPLEPILSGMTALGPLMIVLSTSAGTAAVKWGLHTASLIAHKVALLASTIAIKAVAVAQWLWNAAMAANPIGLIILAIGALIAIGVLLWKNWDKVVEFFKGAWEKMKEGFVAIKNFFVGVWESIVSIFKEHWDKILAILFPAIGIPILIARNWDKIVGFFKGIWEKIVGFFKGAWDAIKAGFFSGINWIIDKINGLISLINKVPGINIGKIGKLGGEKEPEVKGFATGGLITEPTMLYGLKSQRPYGIAGEAGVERIEPGAGATTIYNTFEIAQLIIREEADVPRIARELYILQQQKQRAGGG